eukprot:1011413-Heterocapsa_arctica.AAC.1
MDTTADRAEGVPAVTGYTPADYCHEAVGSEPPTSRGRCLERRLSPDAGVTPKAGLSQTRRSSGQGPGRPAQPQSDKSLRAQALVCLPMPPVGETQMHQQKRS